MEELSSNYKIKIEELYTKVMLLIESEYDIEGVINTNNKRSSKITFRDRKRAIQNVSEAIKEFARENNLNESIVQEYLLHIIDRRTNGIFKENYEKAKEIIIADEDIEER